MNTNNYAELAEKARRIRINALKAIHAAKSGHPGGSLSSADILATLYFGELNIDPKNPKMADRDKFVLSKGHAVPALYAALGERGFYEVSEMMTLRQVGSKFQGHPNMNKVPGIEMSTGSIKILVECMRSLVTENFKRESCGRLRCKRLIGNSTT